MIILGIDPGSRAAGFGLVRFQGRKFTYLESGVLTFDGAADFIDRIAPIYRAASDLAARFEINAVAVESLIYTKSVTSLAKLAQARGAMLAGLSAHYDGKIFEYAPNLIKSTVAGHGHTDKEGMEKIVGMLLGIKSFKRHDEADALAIALTHGLLQGSSSLLRQSTTKSKRSLKDLGRTQR